MDLEKAFDRVPTEVISWAMRKLGVEEWLVKYFVFFAATVRGLGGEICHVQIIGTDDCFDL